MATSGTYAFNLDLSEIIEEAYERAGLVFQSGYDYKTARRSLDLLMLEWQNRGLNLWTVKDTTLTLVAGQSTYALPAEQVEIIEGLCRINNGNSSQQSDLTMQRMSVSRYAQQTDKLSSGRPLQYYVQRTPSNLSVHFWPVPDGAQEYTFAYYYMERVEDSGKPASNNMDVPARFLPCLVLTTFIFSTVPRIVTFSPIGAVVMVLIWLKSS